MFQLKKATRKQVKLKIGLFGPSGSGKTMSALRLAYGLTGDWSKIAVIDTEIISPTQTSAELYADYKGDFHGISFEMGQFLTLRLEAPYTPDRYILAMKMCEDAGIEAIVVDSISHEWEGKGGCLEMAKAFGDWKTTGPAHTRFIEKIKHAKCHVICCGRVKTKYETTEVEKNGKKSYEVHKIGVGIISREGFEFELITAFDLSQEHLAITSKDRTGLFKDRAPFLIDESTGKEFLEWSNSGELIDEPKAEEQLNLVS